MTRKGVYGAALVAFLAAFAMTLASIAIPSWISYDSETQLGTKIHKSLGLHAECSGSPSSGDYECHTFPSDTFCRTSRTFCEQWRTVGFLMSFSVVLHGALLVAFIMMLNSGVQKRLAGRPVLCGLLSAVGIVEIAAMGVIAYVFENDERFFPGWKLDRSWALCTAAWVVKLATAVGIWISVFILPMEGDYELIGDEAEQ